MTDANDDFEMIEINLYSSGKVLKFEGKGLGSSDDQYIAGKEQNRWYSETLYITRSNKYIVVSEYQTRWQGEECSISYETFNTKEALEDYIREQDYHLLNEMMKKSGIPIIIEIE